MTTLFWFRQDLRLSDNPGLHYAIEQGKVIPVFIFDDVNAKDREPGGASRWWLHYSLESLNKSLKGKLNIFRGDPLTIIPKLVKDHNITSVVWNRCYEPWQIARDRSLKAHLHDNAINAQSFNASLLWEPWDVLKKDNTPYKVFTPYYRKGCLSKASPRMPLDKPQRLSIKSKLPESLEIDSLSLRSQLDWDNGFYTCWTPGEIGAKESLSIFLDNAAEEYKHQRNIPSVKGTSHLSPHLHFGEISPNQIWYAAQYAFNDLENENLDCYLSELGWREFSYYLLYHFPSLPKSNFQPKFNFFSWRKSKKNLTAWQKGQTGIPIVDAGMRELWQTGYMHNRVRMIVGSFLVKNLRIHWHEGENWFWDCLVDADLAANAASWQWVAGSGADAAPYFRIFNPVSQGEKFDPYGDYVLRYCPELSGLSKKYIHQPWEASQDLLEQANISLGKTYPKPIVDLKTSRQEALDAFSALKGIA